MKKFFVIVIVLCAMYFVLGYIASLTGFISTDSYLAYTGVIGGIASIAGLISFLKPTINSSDIEALELESLQSLAETSRELKIIEQKREQTLSEFDDLEIRKKEMELLVKKASMTLFLQEQYSQYNKKIRTTINLNSDLLSDIHELKSIEEKLNVLEEEIIRDPNVDFLREIIEDENINKSNTHNDDELRYILTLPPIIRPFFLFVRWLKSEF